MEIGSIGILGDRFFYSTSSRDKYCYVFLTTAHDVTESANENMRSFHELKYNLLENVEPLVCSAMYIGEQITPDMLVCNGDDYSSKVKNTERFKYYKVILSIGDKTEICFLHENSMKFFTWT
jgi:hypothetical protein